MRCTAPCISFTTIVLSAQFWSPVCVINNNNCIHWHLLTCSTLMLMNTSTPSFTCVSVWVFAWGNSLLTGVYPPKECGPTMIYLVAKLSCIIVHKCNVIFTLELVVFLLFFFITHYKILIAVLIEPSGTYQYIYIYIYFIYINIISIIYYYCFRSWAWACVYTTLQLVMFFTFFTMFCWIHPVTSFHTNTI